MLWRVEYGVVDLIEWFGGLELAAVAGQTGKTEDFLQVAADVESSSYAARQIVATILARQILVS